MFEEGHAQYPAVGNTQSTDVGKIYVQGQVGTTAAMNRVVYRVLDEAGTTVLKDWTVVDDATFGAESSSTTAYTNITGLLGVDNPYVYTYKGRVNLNDVDPAEGDQYVTVEVALESEDGETVVFMTAKKVLIRKAS